MADEYTEIITVEGDTFDALALEFYDDESLASIIINANLDHCDTLIFEAGVRLKILELSESSKTDTLPQWRREESS